MSGNEAYRAGKSFLYRCTERLAILMGSFGCIGAA